MASWNGTARRPHTMHRGLSLGVALLLALALLGVSALVAPRSGATDLAPPGKLGVYAGGGKPGEVRAFESWLGRRVPVVLEFLPFDTWAQIENPDWFADQWNGSGYDVVWSVGMLPKSGGSLGQGATGAYNGHFRTLAQRLVAKGQADSIIRLGWEFNGGWFPWKAQGDPGAFAAYWRQVVETMRSVPGAAFRFDWAPNAGYTPFRVEDAYPGDAYVDFIGLDTYDQGWGTGWQDPVLRWQHAVNENYGLRWHRDFAAAHGKPMTFPEWGLFIREDGHGGGDNPYYVERMYEWIAANNVAYALYFEFDAPDGLHRLRGTRFPTAAATFKLRFGPSALPQPAPSTGGVAPAPAPTPTTTAPPTTAAPAPSAPGKRIGIARRSYQVATADGRILSIGNGATGKVPAGTGRVVAVASTPDGAGSWVTDGRGSVVAFGSAVSKGSLAGRPLARPVVGMAATPSGNGYWLVAGDGGIFSFGDARFHGSTGAMRLTKPIVGMASTPSGNGYWLVAADGGIFSFGDARFHGSTGAMRLSKPIVGMATTPGGNGYWLAAADGGIFTFGEAGFRGSAVGHATHPVVGIASTSLGGYWLVAGDGGVFAFGDAAFGGSAAGSGTAVGIAPAQI